MQASTGPSITFPGYVGGGLTVKQAASENPPRYWSVSSSTRKLNSAYAVNHSEIALAAGISSAANFGATIQTANVWRDGIGELKSGSLKVMPAHVLSHSALDFTRQCIKAVGLSVMALGLIASIADAARFGIFFPLGATAYALAEAIRLLIARKP
jgi:hypothetical protein